jgi:hypothetical protein
VHQHARFVGGDDRRVLPAGRMRRYDAGVVGLPNLAHRVARGHRDPWVEAQFLSQRIRPPDPRHGPAGKSESSRSCRSCRLRDPGCWEPAGPACPLGTGCSRSDSGFLCQLRPDAASVGRAAASDGRGAAYGTPQAGPLSQVLKWAGDHAGARHRVAPRRSLRGQWAACRHQLVGINGGPMPNADCWYDG